MFMCADNITCVDLSKVCNSKNDCADGSDEGGACLKSSGSNNICPTGSCPPNAECFLLPFSKPACVCPKNYMYNTSSGHCEVC